MREDRAFPPDDAAGEKVPAVLQSGYNLLLARSTMLSQGADVGVRAQSCLPITKFGLYSHMITSWQVATAAEAFAAAQFARCGWDVSVQYGANQPEYDLVAVNSEQILKISVKGSQDGGWRLTQSYIANADYHGAADKWLNKHSKKTVFCLVQFRGVAVDALPRMYLASPVEIALWLKAAAAGHGDTILYEEHIWTNRAKAAGTADRIPEAWKFTKGRLNEIARWAEPINRTLRDETAQRQ